MKDLYVAFPTRSNPPDANYPSGSAKNVVTQGDGTGTPLTASLENDKHGFHQYCLKKASMTPSNNSETALESQIHDGIRLSHGLPGEVIQHCWTTIPTGVRVLNLEGQCVSISSTYAELAAACYVGDSNNGSAHGFYKTSDEGGDLRDIDGTYMVLPSAQGKFLRTTDPEGLIDVDKPDRLAGNSQDWAMGKHHHRIGVSKTSPTQNVGHGPETGTLDSGGDKLVYDAEGVSSTVPIYATEVIDSDDRPNVYVGHTSYNEIRPENMAVHVGIWY